ncbi:MAG: hypothetical protein ACRCYO_06560, partial [Bacteroidia bacterium]
YRQAIFYCRLVFVVPFLWFFLWEGKERTIKLPFPNPNRQPSAGESYKARQENPREDGREKCEPTLKNG